MKDTICQRNKIYRRNKKITEQENLCSVMAAGTGFEPVQSESESLVLPLHHPAVLRKCWCEGRDLNSQGMYHTPLKRARLPIPPPSLTDNYCIISNKI